jgi:hypothetical protein
MTRGRITFHLSMQGILDPELGLISQKAIILVAGRHIGGVRQLGDLGHQLVWQV